jgi:uncharacterized repeat protein (TIGR01451 family)
MYSYRSIDKIMYKLLIATLGIIATIGATAPTLLPLSAQAQSAPTQSAAQRVVLTLKAEKQVKTGTKIVYEPTTGKSVKPGDVLRYTVSAKNGEKAIKNLMLTQPIPRGTSYLKNSATALNGAELLFSLDGGKSYVAKPMMGKKEAPTTAYTNLRWKFTGTLAAKAQVNATYDVVIK